MKKKEMQEFYEYAQERQKEAVEERTLWLSRVQARQKSSATEYLRIVRALEGLGKAYRGGLTHGRKIATLLGMGRLPASGRAVTHLAAVKLSQATAQQTFDSLALFLVWPRELSLYVRSYGDTEKEVGQHEVVPQPTDRYTVFQGKFMTKSGVPETCCSGCSMRNLLLVEQKLCCSCVLMKRFGATKPVEVQIAAPASNEWPAKGASLPLEAWLAESAPWEYLFHSYCEAVTKTLARESPAYGALFMDSIVKIIEDTVVQEIPTRIKAVAMVQSLSASKPAVTMQKMAEAASNLIGKERVSLAV